MATTSRQNVGDFVFLESQKDLATRKTASSSSLTKSKMKLLGYLLSTSLKI